MLGHIRHMLQFVLNIMLFTLVGDVKVENCWGVVLVRLRDVRLRCCIKIRIVRFRGS